MPSAKKSRKSRKLRLTKRYGGSGRRGSRSRKQYLNVNNLNIGKYYKFNVINEPEYTGDDGIEEAENKTVHGKFVKEEDGYYIFDDITINEDYSDLGELSNYKLSRTHAFYPPQMERIRNAKNTLPKGMKQSEGVQKYTTFNNSTSEPL